jgi:hypothetical protein
MAVSGTRHYRASSARRREAGEDGSWILRFHGAAAATAVAAAAGGKEGEEDSGDDDDDGDGAAAAAAAAAADAGGSDVQVASAEGGTLTLHEGLVMSDGRVAALQARMIAALNALPWTKADVETRVWHAHAAIVVRSPRALQRFGACTDAVEWAADRLAA